MLSEYRLKRRVQFYETDAAGIVHFSWYFRYMEETEHAMWRAAGLSVAPPGNIHWPRVSASCDFHDALSFEQEFEVWLRIAAMSRRTIRYASVISRGSTKIATGTHTVVCVHMSADMPMRAVDIPADIAERFSVAIGIDA